MSTQISAPSLASVFVSLLLLSLVVAPNPPAANAQEPSNSPDASNNNPGGLLCIITEHPSAALQKPSPSDSPKFWWSNSPTFTATTTDLTLLSALRAAHIPVIDPATFPNPPQLSQRVFGRPDLSDANAQNLASLFGASFVLRGDATCDPLPPSVYLREQAGAHASLSVRLMSTRTEQALLSLRLDAAAFAPDTPSACTQALAVIASRLQENLQHATSLQDAQAPIWDGDEPLIILSGLNHAAPLVQLKKHLRTNPEVKDIFERWAAEGHIALDINPGLPDSPESVRALVDSLLTASFPGFRLSPLPAEGRDLRLELVPSR